MLSMGESQAAEGVVSHWQGWGSLGFVLRAVASHWRLTQVSDTNKQAFKELFCLNGKEWDGNSET